MPRNAAKSGRSKRTPTAPVTPAPTQELETHCRLTHTQLNNILIKEERDETVKEMMDELMIKVMDGCLKVYVISQLEPFAACWAKNYLTQSLEQQIMCPDEGEGPEEASKTEDSEPMASLIDSWAQGCVPVVYALPPFSYPTSAQQEADVVQVPGQTGPGDDQQCDAMSQTKSSPKQPDRETSPRKPVINKQCKVLIPQPPPKIDVKKKLQFDFPPKPVPGKLLPTLSRSAAKKDVEEADALQVPAQAGPGDDQQCDPMAQTNSSPKQPDRETSPRRPVNNKQCKVLIPRPPQKVCLKKKPVAGKLLPSLSSSAAKKDVEVEDKKGVYCVYNNMTAPLNKSKAFQSMPRFDLSSLPRHAIFPEYEIVDSDQTKPEPKKPSR